MMVCSVVMGDGSQWKLPTPIRWEFCYGTGQPCDSFFVRCLWEGGVYRSIQDDNPYSPGDYPTWWEKIE